MMKTYKLLMIAGSIAVTGVASADSMPPEKQQELDKQGISSWSSGAGRAAAGGKAFSKIDPVSAGGRSKAKPEARVFGTGTLQYDDGNITALPTIFGQQYGNRFNVRANGTPVPSGALTLNSFSFYFLEDSLADTGLFFQPGGPAATAGILDARASINVDGLVNSGPSFSIPVLNVRNQTVLGTTGVFADTVFLGAWSLNSNTALPVDNEAIGLSTAQFRGLHQGYTASSGTGPVPFTPQAFNAILRANITGDVLPVELMNFEVE